MFKHGGYYMKHYTEYLFEDARVELGSHDTRWQAGRVMGTTNKSSTTSNHLSSEVSGYLASNNSRFSHPLVNQSVLGTREVRVFLENRAHSPPLRL